MDAIRADSVVKHFGTVRALDGVTVEVAAGELFFLLGASGCGKTTLLRCIAGLETPTSGTISFGEKDVTKLPPHKREAAMVFQSYALWPHLNVERNVAFGLEERKIGKAEIRQRVGEALELVHLSGMGGRGPTRLISPCSTLKSCGSSSMLVLRMKRPILVIRGSFFILKAGPSAISFRCASSFFFASASTTIDRNL